jgi:O-antigen ligase
MAVPVAAVGASRRAGPNLLSLGNARHLIYLFALGAGVLMSGSRAGLAGAIGGLAVLPLFNPGRRRSIGLLLVAGLIGASLVALTFDSSLASHLGIVTGQRFTGQAAGTQTSNDYRTHAYAAAFRAIVRNPAMGQGFQQARDAHDIYLQLLQVGGIAAFASFLAFASGAIVTARRIIASHHTPASFATLAGGLGASIVVWLITGLAQNELYDRYLYIPVGLLLAMRLILHEYGGRVQHRAPAVLSTGWSRAEASVGYG